ncbi:MAG: ABC transporter permease [Gemmatimonadota bacterium]
MTFAEALLTGLDEARRHWGQTVLSLLGLILGTASIVTVLALFGGQTALTTQFLNEVGGAGTIIARNKDMAITPTARELRSDRLTFRDAQMLKDRAHTLLAVSPGWSRQLPYRARDVSFDGEVIGTVPDYAFINDIRPLAGRFLGDLDVRRRARVAVLGWKYADSLFGDPASALHQLVNIGGKNYVVVGVMEREEFKFAVWEDNALEYRNRRAYIPITTGIANLSGNDRLDFMTLKARPQDGASVAEAEVRTLLAMRHGVEDFELQPSGRGAGGDNTQFLMLFNFIFLVVGAVSLFTGGIVIANILLASVMERVREFGTRMALGATGVGIFAHVLAQVVVVAVLGGLLGLGLGTALTGTVAHFMQLPAVVSPFIAGLALATALATGLIAGTFPAIQAARLSPVEALRYG